MSKKRKKKGKGLHESDIKALMDLYEEKNKKQQPNQAFNNITPAKAIFAGAMITPLILGLIVTTVLGRSWGMATMGLVYLAEMVMFVVYIVKRPQ
jgi:hypothetical protein